VSEINPTDDVLAIDYGAKSTRDKKDSIPTQLADGRRLAEREGWTVVAEYSDEAASAYTGNRGDGLAQAKAHAERLAAEGYNVVLVVQHTDRLARGDGITADHLVELALWARKAGVRIASVQDPATVEGGLAFAAMMGDRNHADSQRKALAVKDGMARRRAKGLHNGSQRKFGYEYVRDEYGRTVPDQPLRPHAVEREVVERMARDCLAGMSQREIGRALEAEGVRTATGRTTWHQGTVSKILRDPFNAGYVEVGDELVRGQHEAILDPDLWQHVQKVLDEAARMLGPRRGGRPPSANFLFTHGHLRCGRCGGAMVPRTSKRKAPNGGTWGKPYEAYRCYTRIHDKEKCDQRPLPRAAVDATGLAALKERGLSVQQTREQMADALRHEHAAAEARLTEALAEEQRATQRRARVESDYLDGGLSAANYERLSAQLDQELDAARAQREQADRHAAGLDASDAEIDDAMLSSLADVHEAIAQYIADARHIDQLRLRVRQIWEHFTVHDDGDVIAIVATARADAVDAAMADLSAVRREALRATTHAMGLQT
jgi:DNA invertase Pin-like site-specific DNA recombinase